MPGVITKLVHQVQMGMDRYFNGDNEWNNTPYGGPTGKCQHRGGLLIPMDGFWEKGTDGDWHPFRKTDEPECPVLAFTNVLRMWRTTTFPAEANDVIPCGGSRAVLIQAGVARCSMAMDDQGNPPPVDVMEHEALVLEDDAERLFNVMCWVSREAKKANLIDAAVIHPWEPVGPEGGVLSGLISASFQIA